MESGIYLITNQITLKYYVGSAVYLKGRIKHHIRRLNLGLHRNRYLQNAWGKYGESSFTFTILLHCDIKNLLIFEQRAIDFYLSTYGRKAIYNLNLVAGSALGQKRSEETKQRMSIGRSGKPHTAEAKAKMSRDRKGRKPTKEAIAKAIEGRKGFRPSEEQKRKTSQTLMGHNVSEETRAKIRAAVKGKAKGRKLSEETRAKISVALKGKPLSEEHKKKLRTAHTGKQHSEEHKAKLIGRKHSEEHKKKISEGVKAWRARIKQAQESPE